MNKINCVIIDDEPLALNVLGKHIEKIPFLNLISKHRNPLEAMEVLRTQPIDLLFLDIQMPEISGIDFAQSLPASLKVIFTTAYPDYAVKSYELNALDYLVKPIPFDRFLKAINKLKIEESQDKLTIPEHSREDFIYVKSAYKTVKIHFEDILYIESIKDYVYFHLKNNEISSLLSIAALEEKLPSSLFSRVHRSFIVSLDKIDSIERNTIFIMNKTVKIGDLYRDRFFKIIEQRKI